MGETFLTVIRDVFEGELECAGLKLIRVVNRDHLALIGGARKNFGIAFDLHVANAILSTIYTIAEIFLQPQRLNSQALRGSIAQRSVE